MRRVLAVAAVLVLVALVSVGAYFAGRSSRCASDDFPSPDIPPREISSARFAPDGNTIVYSASWEDEPSDIFAVRPDSPSPVRWALAAPNCSRSLPRASWRSR